MFAAAPLPLSHDISLGDLLALTGAHGPLGAWVSACSHRVWIYRFAHPSGRQVLASSDLAFLLRRCARVALRQGARVQVLSTETVIHWRALQVATATPYLPALDRMRAVFPDLRVLTGGFRVPLYADSAEEVLARCVSEGLRVTGSKVVYGAGSMDGVLPVVLPPP